MKTGTLKGHEHFVKLCKHKLLIRENGRPIGVHPAAFELRKPTANHPEQEKTVSGVYYEFYDGAPDEMMHACYHFIDMEIKKKDALLRMEVGSIKVQGEKRTRSLRVRHEPCPQCLGYAALHGLPVDTDDELCALLAKETVRELTEASLFI